MLEGYLDRQEQEQTCASRSDIKEHSRKVPTRSLSLPWCPSVDTILLSLSLSSLVISLSTRWSVRGYGNGRVVFEEGFLDKGTGAAGSKLNEQRMR